MITEDYVSFEVAKLLKEKGFDEITSKAYPVFEEKEYKHDIPCPTLQMTMKWLREVHNIIIIIDTNDIFNENRFYFCRIYWGQGNRTEIKWKISNTDEEHEYFATYEQASEAAILYCLTNLI